MQPFSNDLVLTTSAQTVITSTDINQCTIMKATVANLDTVSHTVTIYRVPSGGSVSNATIMVPNAVIPSTGSTNPLVLPLNGQVLYNGQTLQAVCDNNSSVVNLNISWVQYP